MRKLTADFILNPNGKLAANQTLTVDDRGMIVQLGAEDENGSEYYEGILCPGFINTHCHLELSHLKNKIASRNGLHGFIRDFVSTRAAIATGIGEMAAQADQQMWNNGIQAVGDICNTVDTYQIKKGSPVRYHSFIEMFNFNPDEAAETMDQGLIRYHTALESHKRASLVPHAPYSVPPQLFQLIVNHHLLNKSPWCIHNQETASENELFQTGGGALFDFFQSMGFNLSWIQPDGKSSLHATRSYFPDDTNLLLVHNTFTKIQDVDFLRSEKLLNYTWFSICPKANLYIENTLPDIGMLYDSECRLTIGTDSLASNDSLCILEELKVIHHAFPKIPVEMLLTWATGNGASFFEWNDLGSFHKNTTPGVIWISNADAGQINKNSVVTRLF